MALKSSDRIEQAAVGSKPTEGEDKDHGITIGVSPHVTQGGGVALQAPTPDCSVPREPRWRRNSSYPRGR
jgi:hypothetical protein